MTQTVIPLHAHKDISSTDLLPRGSTSKASSPTDHNILRVTEARDRIAQLLVDDELWALPLFNRLEAELAQLNDQQNTLARARLIAESAAERRRVA